MSETAKAGRPVPKPNTYVDTTPFWEGAKRKELFLQYCKDTGRFQHYPRPVSIYTGSRNLEWRKVSGRGKIYANTVIRIPGPGIDGRLPLPVVTVDLEEGAVGGQHRGALHVAPVGEAGTPPRQPEALRRPPLELLDVDLAADARRVQAPAVHDPEPAGVGREPVQVGPPPPAGARVREQLGHEAAHGLRHVLG